jgi:hypothetical protein
MLTQPQLSQLRRFLPDPAARVLRGIRRTMGITPMQRLCGQLRDRGVDLGRLRALEVFGDDGTRHTMDYAHFLAGLEIWEIRPDREDALRRNFPQATVRIVDSFEEARRTSSTFDLVVVDAWVGGLFDGHCEHFELFPGILRLLNDGGIVVLNVVPRLDVGVRREFASSFNEATLAVHLERRRQFYRTDHPESVTVEQMMAVYGDLSASMGFQIDWYVMQRRLYHLHYLALKLRRSSRLPRLEPGESTGS